MFTLTWPAATFCPPSLALLLSPHPSDGSIITSTTAASAAIVIIVVIIGIAIAVLLDVVTLLTMAIMTTTTTTTTTTTVICGVQGFARAAIRGGLQGRGGMAHGT